MRCAPGLRFLYAQTTDGRGLGNVGQKLFREAVGFAQFGEVEQGAHDRAEEIFWTECFGGRLRTSGLGWCTENSGQRLAARMDEVCRNSTSASREREKRRDPLPFALGSVLATALSHPQ